MQSRWRTFLGTMFAAVSAHRENRFNLLGCVLAMLYAVPTAWYPFGSDQGIHWYLGHALLGGEVPYASGISGKPPLIFVVHALAEVLFGNRQASIRILEIVALPGFAYLIAKGVRRPAQAARDGEVGAAALLLSAANFTYQDYWNTAHPEFYMTLTLSAALVVAVHQPHARRRAVTVGALCMVAFLLKYPAAAIALPIAAYCGFRALYGDAPRSFHPTRAGVFALLREAAWFLAGAAAVFAVCVAPFALTGTMREMIEVCVYMTENYAVSASLPRDWYAPLFDPARQGPLYISLSFVFFLGVIRRAVARDWRELSYAGFLLLVAAAAVASVVLQKRLFNYHWIATYASVIALALWGLRQLTEPLPLRAAGPAVTLFAVLWCVGGYLYQPEFVTAVPHTYREHVTRWWKVVAGDEPADSLKMTYHRKAQADKFGDLVRASDEIRRRAHPGDAVCLTCFISPIYQLTGLRCNTRHAIGTFTLLGPDSWVTELNHHLQADPPRFMVSIRAYPRRNKQLVKHGYREVARYGTVIVFEHFGPAVRASRGEPERPDVSAELPRFEP